MRDPQTDDPLAVIFDVDGVLVDSYQAHFLSWKEIAAETGLEMTQQQFDETFGRTSREIIRRFWGAGQMTDDEIRAIDERKEAAYRVIIDRDFPAMPGAVDLIRALYRDGFTLAVGSSGPPENVELTLQKLGQDSLFDAVVTGRDVRHGKPDPQVFLVAAARLRISPERCVVVEDSPLGIEAAHAAGMSVIGLVSTGHTRKQLADADLVVGRLADLSPARIEELILSRMPADEEQGDETADDFEDSEG